MDYLAREDIVKEFSERTLFLPAHKGVVAKGGLKWDQDGQECQGLRSISSSRPQARHCRLPTRCRHGNGPIAYYGALVTRVSQVMAGELTLDDAWAKIDQDIADKVAAGASDAPIAFVRTMAPAPRLRRRSSGWRRSSNAPLKAWQRATGTGGMAAFFLAPNMADLRHLRAVAARHQFRLFDATSGTALFLADRTFVGADAVRAPVRLAATISTRRRCREDLFWKAVRNTAVFVILQVALMTVVSLVTALILNREIVARSFWRAVFFFPVLLSPVVVGLIWRWILQRQGLLNLMRIRARRGAA